MCRIVSCHDFTWLKNFCDQIGASGSRSWVIGHPNSNLVSWVVPIHPFILLLSFLALKKNYTNIDPKQHKFQKNHMSALCHAHRFLWFPCMGLCSVMSIGLRLCVCVFFFCAALPPRCFQSNIILLWIVAHVMLYS